MSQTSLKASITNACSPLPSSAWTRKDVVSLYHSKRQCGSDFRAADELARVAQSARWAYVEVKQCGEAAGGVRRVSSSWVELT